ncbi:beta-ketoacyl-ACP synthase II [Shewanella sp. NKUCC05_KAH]|uniref:3-oxoacyl-[acyl-carrier-protein] synthase 2 n=1 Tax=Shewanella oncorhynchi TaxID=2726434 RepID=A0AA50KAQ6_9GAMM|nr:MULTISPECIES: beta-ketoacyl-ACP synthase II [Shewanella]EGT3625667.1 beta-ketoacyl-[acyl-carrier-protein] synthase II [Morganella morganii]MBI1673749.1 beta-ketoacyl-ACP synthase II [Shewanella sp. DW31]MBW3515437.1 beta-ketoacyl-ACP synthase II [Shewanella sp. NKUCC01_JLK]MBW3525536.1 beta-ketoacyl-ACP synthase II [Shewanella sp. NKUCC05_KAH]RBP82751.1 3-oxoacyl-[acyl-carrier-protein] synthase II [Shewanella putrefaciens]GCF89048.1 3-oxoacyl-[acyl-carrier-protein] synthase 2 [Shewanella s
MSKRRVVVTGLGLVTPVGNTVDTTWKALLSGKSGIAPITKFDASEFTTRFSGSVKDFDVEQYVTKKDARKMDLFIQYGMAAGIQAIQDSGLDMSKENPGRVGTAIGAGMGGMWLIEQGHSALMNGGPRKVSPFFVPSTIINMISGHLSIMFGMKGPNFAVTTACTTGVHNIGFAARTIAYGDADVMVAGGAEDVTSPLGVAGFGAAKALSTRNDDPTAASRPWDKDRDGFVIGDGAGVMVMEEYEHAKARGATIYGELVGFGMSGDAFHMTSPPSDGAGAAAAMVNAINDAKLSLEQIGYINAHGTSTPAGDKAEAAAVKSVFGDHAYKVLVSSTKSMTGHLLGAAGAVEAIFTLLALRDQAVPPTINLDNPDEGCDLDFVAHTARDVKMDYALCNSFGFGGTNGSLLFKKV